MYNYNQQGNPMQMMPNMDTITIVEPFLIQTLQTLLNQRLIVDTNRGSIEGFLIDVKPDHIVLQDRQSDQPQFVRTAQIVFVMPINQ